MEELEVELMTFDEADFVDITEEAIDASAQDTINLVPSLKSDSVLPDVYTIGADGKLVSVANIQDFKKHHDTVAETSEENDDSGTYAIGEEGEVVHVSNMKDFEKHHKQGVEFFRKEAFKKGAAHVSYPKECYPQTKIQIRNIPATVKQEGVKTVHSNVHVFSVPIKRVVKPVVSKPRVVSRLPEEAAKVSAQQTETGVPLPALPVSSPITYINGVAGQIVSGRQLEELRSVLGYRPEIVTNTAVLPSDLARLGNPPVTTTPEVKVVMPATVSPVLRKPLTKKIFSAQGGPGVNVKGRKVGAGYQDVSQTIIAKNSATYQREKNYYFSQTSLLSPLIPPHLTNENSGEATTEATHLSSKVSLMTEISEDWNMQGCITFGTGTEGQVFAPRLLVPLEEGNVASYATVEEHVKRADTITGSASDELMQYQGMYTVNGLDLYEGLFSKRESPPSDSIGTENVYSSFEGLTGVRQEEDRLRHQENDLIEEDIEDEKSDMEVEFELGENEGGGKITLNLKKMGDPSDDVQVWTVKKESDESFSVKAPSTSQNTLENSAREAVTSAPKPMADPFEKYSGHACYLCLFASKDRQHVLQHWLDCHKSAKPYVCPYCKQEFGVSCNVFNHIVLHHPNQGKKSFLLAWSPIFKNTVEVTMTDEGIASHVEIHDDPGPVNEMAVRLKPDFVFRCLGCDYRSTKVTAVRKHLKAVHYRVMPYLCPYCGSSFNNGFDAKRHVCMHHQQWPIKVFVSKKRLQSIDDTVLNQRFDAISLATVNLAMDGTDLLGACYWEVTGKANHWAYKCRKCAYGANLRNAIYNHVVSTHRALHGVICPKCKFYNHLKQESLKEGWADCEKCMFFLNLNVDHKVGDGAEELVTFYICLECKHYEKGKSNMVQHLQYYHLKCRPFSCAYCDYSHMEKGKVRLHILLKHKNKPVHIMKNTDMDKRVIEVMRGMTKKVSIPQSIVSVLSKQRPSTDWSIEEPKAAPPSRIQKSDVISVSKFRRKAALKKATKASKAVRLPRYSCNLCDHVSRDRYAMNRHIKSYHLNGKPYSCSCCGYGASFKYLVERHMQVCHPSAPAYVNTNYKMLELLDVACKQYYKCIAKNVQPSNNEGLEPYAEPSTSLGSIKPLEMEDDSEDPDEEDLEEMMVQEDEESDDEKPDLDALFASGSNMAVPYLPIGEMKKKIFDLYPEFQLDQNLVNEPVVILEDIMKDILKCEKPW